jgi:hypothetical protein
MQNIDFLPQKYREQTAQRKAQRWRLLVVVGFGLVLAIGAYGQQRLRQKAGEQLALVRAHYDASTAQAAQLAGIETDLRRERTTADLATYLRHPWPRTRIIDAVLSPLPESITLRKLQIQRETAPPSALRDPKPIHPAGEAAPKDLRSPSQKDLDRLRELYDTAPTVVTLEGMTNDQARLHSYLGKLAEGNFFSKTALVSLESASEAGSGMSKFRARLNVRAGWGQSGGPNPAEQKK